VDLHWVLALTAAIRAGVAAAPGTGAASFRPEVQEEVTWLCEASHIPVIWATQVLEGLVHDGSPSRAEATDAAMSQRAERVMLNKGPFLPEGYASSPTYCIGWTGTRPRNPPASVRSVHGQRANPVSMGRTCNSRKARALLVRAVSFIA
jgi:hypothetical protein